jgi:hypothetical protein
VEERLLRDWVLRRARLAAALEAARADAARGVSPPSSSGAAAAPPSPPRRLPSATLAAATARLHRAGAAREARLHAARLLQQQSVRHATSRVASAAHPPFALHAHSLSRL